jgi:glycosyltransferase involved in cell wall biosynthesis
MTGIKVAHLARWLEVGGTEQVIFDLCRLGSGKNWVVAFQDGPMRPVFERAGIEVRLGTTPELLTQHLADADVVNIHWFEYQPAMFATAVAASRPMVFTLHGYALLPKLPGQVLCTSRRALELQKNNQERCVLIPNAVDTDVFKPPAERRAGPVRLIRVCRPIRCAEYFWPAICQVLVTCPETELRIVGGETYRCERVEALGNRHDVAAQLAEADIFVYTPWPHEGTLDLVVLEALATGLPCVVSDVPCVNESVEQGVTGLISHFGDVDALADNLRRLIQDRELRESMGRRAVQVARERFSMRQRVKLYDAAYARALSKVPVPTGMAAWQQTAAS